MAFDVSSIAEQSKARSDRIKTALVAGDSLDTVLGKELETYEQHSRDRSDAIKADSLYAPRSSEGSKETVSPETSGESGNGDGMDELGESDHGRRSEETPGLGSENQGSGFLLGNQWNF